MEGYLLLDTHRWWKWGGGGGTRGKSLPPLPNQLEVGAVPPFQSHAYQYCIIVEFSV